jgi:catechol 2,3-dioxygenase
MTGLRGQKIELGAVGLSVADLERSLAFYRSAIGMEVLERTDGVASLGVDGRRLLALEERRGAKRDPNAADLFHFALLLPSRAALGRQLRHLLEAEVALTGAADHHVSEALYLDDPDGHGIELYRDRPRADWLVDGRIRLTNARLDREGILAEGRASGRAWSGLDPGTGMGHVHLQTHDLPRAQRFYVERLGFDVIQSDPQVTFMSVAGYHHHVAVNAWNRKRHPAAPEAGGIGLLWYEIRLQQAADLTSLSTALPDAHTVNGTLNATDPSGIALRFTRA